MNAICLNHWYIQREYTLTSGPHPLTANSLNCRYVAIEMTDGNSNLGGLTICKVSGILHLGKGRNKFGFVWDGVPEMWICGCNGHVHDNSQIPEEALWEHSDETLSMVDTAAQAKFATIKLNTPSVLNLNLKSTPPDASKLKDLHVINWIQRHCDEPTQTRIWILKRALHSASCEQKRSEVEETLDQFIRFCSQSLITNMPTAHDCYY